MSQAQAVSPLLLALVAGGFTTFGVVLKIGYDAIAARRAARTAGLERFADERRQACEKFYDSVKNQLEANKALMAMVKVHHKEGKYPRYRRRRKLLFLRRPWPSSSPH